MKSMFTMLMTEGRNQKFDFITKLVDYQNFNKAEIVDAGLDMLITNAQQPAEPEDSINLFSSNDEIIKFCREHNKDKKLKRQMEFWVKSYNEVTKI